MDNTLLLLVKEFNILSNTLVATLRLAYFEKYYKFPILQHIKTEKILLDSDKLSDINDIKILSIEHANSDHSGKKMIGNSGITYYHICIKYNFLATFIYLANKIDNMIGLNDIMSTDKNNLFYFAVVNNNLNLMDVFVYLGIDINNENKHGYSAIYYSKSKEMFYALLHRGAKIHKDKVKNISNINIKMLAEEEFNLPKLEYVNDSDIFTCDEFKDLYKTEIEDSVKIGEYGFLLDGIYEQMFWYNKMENPFTREKISPDVLNDIFYKKKKERRKREGYPYLGWNKRYILFVENYYNGDTDGTAHLILARMNPMQLVLSKRELNFGDPEFYEEKEWDRQITIINNEMSEYYSLIKNLWKHNLLYDRNNEILFEFPVNQTLFHNSKFLQTTISKLKTEINKKIKNPILYTIGDNSVSFCITKKSINVMSPSDILQYITHLMDNDDNSIMSSEDEDDEN